VHGTDTDKPLEELPLSVALYSSLPFLRGGDGLRSMTYEDFKNLKVPQDYESLKERALLLIEYLYKDGGRLDPQEDKSSLRQEEQAEASKQPSYLLRVPRTNRPDLEFKGFRLAEAKSSAASVRLAVYKTEGGSYVGVKELYTPSSGDLESCLAEVTRDVKELISFFGYGNLAKELYGQLGLNIVETLA
jgi:hypothetical protein